MAAGKPGLCAVCDVVYAEAAHRIITLLTALYMKAADKAAPLFQYDGILLNIRVRGKHWLTFVFRPLINSRHRLRTRFAFCL
jgi:hypothetical protein